MDVLDGQRMKDLDERHLDDFDGRRMDGLDGRRMDDGWMGLYKVYSYILP
jgi:hypothetical protein